MKHWGGRAESHVVQPGAVGAVVAFGPEEGAAAVQEQRHVLGGRAELHGHIVGPA